MAANDTTIEIDSAETIAALRRETIDAMYDCLLHAAAALARDHESCVRRSCRRARRCRRTPCLADDAE